MKIKINHEDSYIIIDFDIENEKATIVENNANDFQTLSLVIKAIMK